MSEINTHNMRIEFGKHKGELVTRLPISYLEWLINEGTHFAPVAEAELKRRGLTPGNGRKIEITNHAIDRASLRIMGIYLAEHQKNEGLFSWLERIALEALENLGDVEEQDFRIDYGDMKLVFKRGKLYPTLVTVLKGNYERQQ